MRTFKPGYKKIRGKSNKASRRRAKQAENYDKAKLRSSGLWSASANRSKLTITRIVREPEYYI